MMILLIDKGRIFRVHKIDTINKHQVIKATNTISVGIKVFLYIGFTRVTNS